MPDKIELIIKTTILQEMISAAYAANMHKKFIDGIKLVKIDDETYQIRNDWKGPNDEPLAKYHEYGTKDHYIKGNPLLVWTSSGPQSGRPTAIFSKRADNKKGNTLFSRGHFVKGIEAKEPMTNGFKIGSERMARELELVG